MPWCLIHYSLLNSFLLLFPLSSPLPTRHKVPTGGVTNDTQCAILWTIEGSLTSSLSGAHSYIECCLTLTTHSLTHYIPEPNLWSSVAFMSLCIYKINKQWYCVFVVHVYVLIINCSCCHLFMYLTLFFCFFPPPPPPLPLSVSPDVACVNHGHIRSIHAL